MQTCSRKKNCLFSTSKNLWIFLDLNFLTIFTQKMYLHAKRIFNVRKKFHRKNLLKNWKMSENSKKLCHEKKKLPSKIFRLFFAIFWWIFFFAKFLHLHAKEKKMSYRKMCVKLKKSRSSMLSWANVQNTEKNRHTTHQQLKLIL